MCSLHRELVQHGAGFLQYLDSKTMATHIIASTLPPKKLVEFNKYRIVKPAWVTDSINAGRLLPWTDYRVIDESPRRGARGGGGGGGAARGPRRAPRGGGERAQNSGY